MKLGRKRQPLSQLQVYCKDTHLICAVNLFLLSKKYSADRRAVLNILRDLRLHQSQRPRVNTEATHPDHHIRFPILQALTFKRGSCWEDNEKSNTSSRWSCAATAQRERDLAGNASTETRAAPSEGLRGAVSTRPNPTAAPQGSARLGSARPLSRPVAAPQGSARPLSRPAAVSHRPYPPSTLYLYCLDLAAPCPPSVAARPQVTGPSNKFPSPRMRAAPRPGWWPPWGNGRGGKRRQPLVPAFPGGAARRAGFASRLRPPPYSCFAEPEALPSEKERYRKIMRGSCSCFHDLFLL